MSDLIRRSDVYVFQDAIEPHLCKHLASGEVFSATKDADLIEFIDSIPAVDAVEIERERLLSILRSYFQIGDSYTFELTRVKEAFEIGTMTFDDFVEWDEDNINDLCDYILGHCGARMDGEEEHNAKAD